VWPRARQTHDFFHAQTSDQECISYQRAMAPPRHGFSTHYRSPSFLGDLDELIEGLLKFWRLHVVGEAAEAGISPTSID